TLIASKARHIQTPGDNGPTGVNGLNKTKTPPPNSGEGVSSGSGSLGSNPSPAAHRKSPLRRVFCCRDRQQLRVRIRVDPDLGIPAPAGGVSALVPSSNVSRASEVKLGRRLPRMPLRLPVPRTGRRGSEGPARRQKEAPSMTGTLPPASPDSTPFAFL